MCQQVKSLLVIIIAETYHALKLRLIYIYKDILRDFFHAVVNLFKSLILLADKSNFSQTVLHILSDIFLTGMKIVCNLTHADIKINFYGSNELNFSFFYALCQNANIC